MGKELGEWPLIDYNRDSWWTACFSWRGTVLPYIFLRVGLLTGFCLLLCLLNEHVLKPAGKPLTGLDPIGHTIMKYVTNATATPAPSCRVRAVLSSDTSSTAT